MVAVPLLANPLDDPGDAAALARHSAALVDAVDAAIGAWVVRSVRQRWLAWAGTEPSGALLDAAEEAGQEARAEVVPQLRALLELDVDAQRSNPLSLIRRATHHATSVLVAAGVPSVVRDPDAERLFPEDLYDLVPASFSDLDPVVHEPGLVWGAAKAHVILRRRRSGR
ncbi:MAG: hypothetical protein ABIY48_02645 [Acidimicrobiales bacterium]